MGIIWGNSNLQRFARYCTRVAGHYDSSIWTKVKELSNQELMLWKHGTIIVKTWEVENIGIDTWPKDTAIYPETSDIECKIPELKNRIDPGVKIKITIPIKVLYKNLTKSEHFDNKIIEFKFFLFSPSKGIFGDSMRLYWTYDENEFDLAFREDLLLSSGSKRKNNLIIDKSRVFI